jgi:drug/metabolite transporter (DMT)-like permease
MKPSDFLQLVVLGAIWGASFLFTRIAVPALGPTWLVGVRIGSGALFLLGTALLLRRSLAGSGRTVDNLRHYAILGFFNTGFPFLLFAYAATTLTASLLSILNSTAPIWGAVIGAAMTRTLPVPRVLLGLAAGTTGVALLVLKDASAAGAGSMLPVLAGIAAPFCYGLASHYARLRTGHLEPMTVAHGSMWGALACLAPTFAVAEVPAMPGAGVGAAALALGVFCTGLAYLMYFKLVKNVGATSALTVTFLIPAFGILWGVLFLGEDFGPATVLGATIVLVGTALVTGFNPLTMFARPPVRG